MFVNKASSLLTRGVAVRSRNVRTPWCHLHSEGNPQKVFTSKRIMIVGLTVVAAGCMVGYNEYNQLSKRNRMRTLKLLHTEVTAARDAVGDGENLKALEHYKQARFHVDFTKMSTTEIHNQVFLNIVEQLGHLAYELERWDEAEQYLTQAEAVVLENDMDQDGDNYLHVLLELAVVDMNKGRPREAYSRFVKCVDRLEKKLEPHDINDEGYPQRLKLFGIALSEYGNFLLQNGDPVSALEAFSKSLNICRSVLGPSHEQTSVLANNLATVYEELGDFDEAARYAEKAVEIAQSSAPHYLGVYKRNLGQILLHKGDSIAGRKLIEEASQILASEDKKAK